MKTTTKKILGMLLAVVMLLSLCCTTVFAAGKGKITIDNAVDGQTYTIYKLFDLESYDVATNAYSYKITAAWNEFFTTGAGAAYVNIDGGYVTAATGFDATTAEDFAKLALAWAKEKEIAPAATPVEKTAGATVEFAGLDLGYYLVDSSLGTLCALTTTNPEQTVVEKNNVPTIEKEVKHNPGETWGKSNDATIGDTIYYEVTVTGQKGAENYVVHDVMDETLTLNADSFVIKVRDEAISGDKYEVLTTGLTDGCTFEIVFSKAFCDSIVNNQEIVITYSAVLNGKALIADKSNNNKVQLEYGNKNYTEWDEVKTYTYKIQLVKTTNDKTVLEGAEFKLYYGSNDKEILVYEVSEGVYRPVTEATQTPTTIKAGTPVVEGLDAGSYYLTEEVAPSGYNKLAGKINFEITHEVSGGEVTPGTNLMAELSADGSEWVSGGVQVINQTGSIMPETGAKGTIIFIALGAVIALGGYVVLVSKKRLDAEVNG